MSWCFPTVAFLPKQFLVTAERSLAKEDPLRYAASQRDGDRFEAGQLGRDGKVVPCISVHVPQCVVRG